MAKNTDIANGKMKFPLFSSPIARVSPSVAISFNPIANDRMPMMVRYIGVYRSAFTEFVGNSLVLKMY